MTTSDATVFINVHTHQSPTVQNTPIRILNQFLTDSFLPDASGRRYSVGLHPWHTDQANPPLDYLEKLMTHQQVVAVGEIGLDALKGATEHVQEQLFLKQIELAEDANKPVIIHCVKRFDRLLYFRKQYKQTPWIVHGFTGNQQLANQLIKADCYLSFGTALLSPSAKLAKTISALSLDRIFFETDTSPTPIETIYQHAAQIKNIPLSQLKSVIMHNFTQIF